MLLVTALLIAAVVVIELVQPGLWAEWREERLRQSAAKTDAEISAAAQDARRAMNRAAGQGWRNRFE